MKANGAKRKIFSDAVDLLAGRKRFALWRMESGCCRLTVSGHSGGIRSGCMRGSVWRIWWRALRSMGS